MRRRGSQFDEAFVFPTDAECSLGHIAPPPEPAQENVGVGLLLPNTPGKEFGHRLFDPADLDAIIVLQGNTSANDTGRRLGGVSLPIDQAHFEGADAVETYEQLQRVKRSLGGKTWDDLRAQREEIERVVQEAATRREVQAQAGREEGGARHTTRAHIPVDQADKLPELVNQSYLVGFDPEHPDQARILSSSRPNRQLASRNKAAGARRLDRTSPPPSPPHPRPSATLAQRSLCAASTRSVAATWHRRTCLTAPLSLAALQTHACLCMCV